MSAEDEGDRPARRFSGQRAREARRAAGKTQREVAAAIGRTHAAVSHYEAGLYVPGPEAVVQYAVVLGVEVDALLEPLPAKPAPSAREALDDLDAARQERGRLVHDPCDPVLVPGGLGKHIICGRMRTPAGGHILDTFGGS